MKNEDFLELLGNIDDCLIDECISQAVVRKRHGYLKHIVTLAAVFLLTVCAVIISRIVPDDLLTVFVEDYTVLGDNEKESSVFYEETVTVHYSEDPLLTEEPSLTEKPTLTEEPFLTEESLLTEKPSSAEMTTEAEITEPPVPESTMKQNSDLPAEGTTEQGISSPQNGPCFIEVPYDELLSAGTDNKTGDYTDSKAVSLQELLRICRMLIIPSFIGELFPGYQSVIGDTSNILADEGNLWSKDTFRFILPDSSMLNIEVAKQKLPLNQAEAENMEFASEIEGASVLLLKGSNAENEMIFTGYFEKNGVYFRITQQGTDLSETDFIKIVKSFI